MWRLIYLFLLFVRVYLALCPSYLHPDEIFQGPEPIAGMPTYAIFIYKPTIDIIRNYFSLPEPSDLGMDIVSTHPQRFSLMANLWVAYDFVEVDMGPR